MGELGVLVDGGFDGLFVHCEVEICAPHPRPLTRLRARGEERGFQIGADSPVGLQCVHVGFGDAALQVACDVLFIFRFAAVDVAREVEVVFVLFDFGEADHACVFRVAVVVTVEHIHDLVDVAIAQAVFWAVLEIAFAGIEHEDAFAGVGVFLVDDDDAGGDAGAVKQVGGQADDAFDVALAQEVAADVGLGVAAKQHAVRQDARALAIALERTHDVQQVGVVALLGGRCTVVLKAFVWVVRRVEAGGPALVGERRIGDDVVEGLERIAFLEQWIGQRVALFDLSRGRIMFMRARPEVAPSFSWP